MLPLSLMMVKEVLQKREVRTALAIAFTVALFFLLNYKMTKLEDLSTLTKKDPTVGLPQDELIPKVKEVSSSTVAILVYHKILTIDPQVAQKHTSLKKFNVDPEIFREEMSYVIDKGYTVLTMHDLLARVREGNMPEKPLVITFDDGWKSQYQNALPVLNFYNLPATFYIYTGVVGSPAYMNWDELKDLVARGMEIGGHTKTHPRLTKVPLLRLNSELSESKTLLQNKLGILVTDFAYPYGDYNDLVIKAVKQAGYLSARTSKQGLPNDFKDLYQLKVIYAPNTLESFKRVLH